ncbi:MAG: hypothetical protein IJM18_00480 [Clostridia bacterium]|nr:hypothetical protein [Clostridia bacterium]
MEMRSLYTVNLPTEREERDDKKTHEDWIKKNESCLNMNFGLISDKLYELELRMAVLETALESLSRQGGGTLQSS